MLSWDTFGIRLSKEIMAFVRGLFEFFVLISTVFISWGPTADLRLENDIRDIDRGRSKRPLLFLLERQGRKTPCLFNQLLRVQAQGEDIRFPGRKGDLVPSHCRLSISRDIQCSWVKMIFWFVHVSTQNHSYRWPKDQFNESTPAVPSVSFLESWLDNHCTYPLSSIRGASQHGKYFVEEIIELVLRLPLHLAGEMLQSVPGPF